MREKEEAKNEYRKKAQVDTLFGDQPRRERRLFKEDGTPNQMNTAKWPFSIEEDELCVRLDVALPKFLDSAQARRARRRARCRATRRAGRRAARAFPLRALRMHRAARGSALPTPQTRR